jgi:hypothetical protein
MMFKTALLYAGKAIILMLRSKDVSFWRRSPIAEAEISSRVLYLRNSIYGVLSPDMAPADARSLLMLQRHSVTPSIVLRVYNGVYNVHVYNYIASDSVL